MIERKITSQRCYKIPRVKLDLFLVQLNMLSDSTYIYFEAEFIFEAGPDYDVVVNTFGSYPYVSNKLDGFYHELRAEPV